MNALNLKTDNDSSNPNPSVAYIVRAPLKQATSSNFFSHVLEGLNVLLESKGLQPKFLGSEADLNPVKLRDQIDADESLLGLVVMGETNEAYFETLSKLHKPIVCVNARFPGTCHSVNANEFQAAQKLLQHYKDLGHKRLGYVGSRFPSVVNKARLDALHRAIEIYNFRFKPEHHIIVHDASRYCGHEAAKSILAIEGKDRPTGWICSGGVLARGIVEILLDNGMSLGKDFGISAFDQTRILTDDKPSITGAATNPNKLGRIAGQVLFDSLSSKEEMFQELVIPADIQLLDTTQA